MIKAQKRYSIRKLIEISRIINDSDNINDTDRSPLLAGYHDEDGNRNIYRCVDN
jgi:hypothetical protein